MPKNTYGPQVKARVQRLLEALLDFVNGEFEESSFDIKCRWEAEDSANPKLKIRTTLVTLEWLTAKDKYPDKLTKTQIREALSLLKDFLKILEDNRTQTKGVDIWHFTLRLWSKNQEKNLKQFEQAWETSRPEKSKALQANYQKSDEFDWAKTCRAMLEKHKRLTTNELLFADEEMKFQVNQIHVPLALVQRTKTEKRNQDISPEQGTRIYEPSYEEKQRFEHQAFLAQVIRDGVGKTKGERIALIGEPGAGKTTQLQAIAFWILENNLGLPIWISLADLQGKSVEDYLLQNWLKNATDVVRVTAEQENNFAELFKNKDVWLLLDAADEMSSLQPLTDISQQLTGWVKNARVVLTCRMNVWEANGGALADFETYRLLDFDYPQQVQEFIQKWFQPRNLTPQPPLLVKERGSKEGEELSTIKERGSENNERGSQQGEELWTQLNQPERQRIQDLVKNPLRLALLCSTWQSSEQGLPETKAGLYQQFVQEFYKWKENRFPTTEEQQEELNAALGRLSKKAIDQETSRFRLRHKLVREELGDREEENSLFYLALKLGWLNEVGIAAESKITKKVYAFYHPTFEEYFAALAVENWREDFLNHPLLPTPHSPLPTESVYRIFSPQWKEVILLWLGREDVEKEEKEEFIEALVEFNDGCGEYKAIDRVRRGFYEFRAYFLAAAAVAEFKDYTKADAIVADIVKWGFGEFKVEQNEWVQFLEPIAQGARTALPQTNRTKAIDALVELIDNLQLDDDTRLVAAQSLGQIASGNENAIAALVELICNPQLNDSTRIQAVSSLGEIDPGNQKAIAALVELIGKPQLDDHTRRRAAESLGKIDPGNEKAIAALVELIGKPQVDYFTRSLAAYSLGEIGSGNEKAIDALVELIDKPQLDDLIRIEAVSSLGKIGSGNQKAIATLVELIRNPQLDDYTRRQAAYSLGKIVSGNQKAIAALVELIPNPQLDEFTRRQAVYNLGEIGSGNQKAIAALVELIDNPQVDDHTRRQAAYSLGKIDPGNQKAIAALVELIDNPQVDDHTRSLAAGSLGEIGSGNEKAIDALVELINNPQLDDFTRKVAAFSLGQIGSDNEKAIDTLVKLIDNPQLDDSTRTFAAYSLEGNLFEEQMPSVVTGLKNYLSDATYKNEFDRFRDCYSLIWNCAQSMPYPAFYQAWHQQEKVKDGE